MRSKSCAEGSGRGVLSISSQAASTAGVGEGSRAIGTGGDVAIEENLIGRGEKIVDRIGQEFFAVPALGVGGGPESFELEVICHLYDLPFYTLQQSCQFRPAAADTAFNGSFGNFEHEGDLLVIHVFEVAENDGLAELGREFLERALDGSFKLEAAVLLLLAGRGVGQALGHGGTVVVRAEGLVE